MFKNLFTQFFVDFLQDKTLKKKWFYHSNGFGCKKKKKDRGEGEKWERSEKDKREKEKREKRGIEEKRARREETLKRE